MTSMVDSTFHQGVLIEVYQTPRIRLGTTLSHLLEGRLAPWVSHLVTVNGTQ